MSNQNRSTNEQEAGKRLPCRGCTNSCENYNHCNGKLWRMSYVPSNKSLSLEQLMHTHKDTADLLE